MERRRLADILANQSFWQTNRAMFNQPFGGEPAPLHFKFQDAYWA